MASIKATGTPSAKLGRNEEIRGPEQLSGCRMTERTVKCNGTGQIILTDIFAESLTADAIAHNAEPQRQTALEQRTECLE